MSASSLLQPSPRSWCCQSADVLMCCVEAEYDNSQPCSSAEGDLPPLHQWFIYLFIFNKIIQNISIRELWCNESAWEPQYLIFTLYKSSLRNWQEAQCPSIVLYRVSTGHIRSSPHRCTVMPVTDEICFYFERQKKEEKQWWRIFQLQ